MIAAHAPWVIGHRGAPGHRPEHTRSSYELALTQGVDAVEPDIVPTSDGVLVVRHENELSSTTDVADRPRFAARRTTKTVDGRSVSGWFSEDFTWDELQVLRARERLPAVRPENTAFDGTERILRLVDVIDIVRAASTRRPSPAGLVVEIKHAAFFAARGFDMAALLAGTLRDCGVFDGGMPLVVESFEPTVLQAVAAHDVPGRLVQLCEASGRPADLVAERGRRAPTYAQMLTPQGLLRMGREVQGVSVAKSLLLAHDGVRLVDTAHDAGLDVFTWTCRPENMFLSPRFRTRGPRRARGRYAAEWGALRDTGVDGVFVDHPDLWAQAVTA